MHKYKIGLVELRLLSLTIILFSTFIKAIFYIKIKSKKKREFSAFVKSFKSWYLDHHFHNSENNNSKQQFYQASNIINIFWYLAVVVFLVTLIMSDKPF